MYHFGIIIHFKTKNVLCLNIIFNSFFYKIIWITVINIYSFIYFTYLFNFCDRASAHIFFVLITHEIALDTRLYVIVFLFLLPYNIILYITFLVEMLKYFQYISSYFCYYFIFSRSHERNIPVSKRVDVSRPSIYMN